MTIMGDIKDELITTLQTNTTFKHPIYRSMWEVGTNTGKPCHSIDLDRDIPDENEYSGGMVRLYQVDGVLITYLEPEIPETSIGDELDKYRDAAKDVLQDKEDSGTYTKIREYNYLESYPAPWTDEYQGGLRLLAHRMITKFTIKYEVR
jgi:hypothetical protein